MFEEKPVIQSLMAKPLLSWEEFWQFIVGLPDSTAEQVSREDPRPKFFLLGRRRYIRTADAIDWIEKRSIEHEWSPRKNNSNQA